MINHDQDKGHTQCWRLPHEWGLGKRKTEASLLPAKSAERLLRMLTLKMQQLLLVHTTLIECISILCDHLAGALHLFISVNFFPFVNKVSHCILNIAPLFQFSRIFSPWRFAVG